MSEFCELFKNSIRGKYDPSGSSKLGKDLAGGAAIRQYLN